METWGEEKQEKTEFLVACKAGVICVAGVSPGLPFASAEEIDRLKNAQNACFRRLSFLTITNQHRYAADVGIAISVGLLLTANSETDQSQFCIAWRTRLILI